MLKKESNVVILGASFIGMETAAYLSDKCASVTVIGQDKFPFNGPFGDKIGERVMKLYEAKGVKFQMSNGVKECIGENNIVTEVVLNDETKLKTDIFVMGVGSTFNTEFLRDSGLDINPDGSITVNNYMETNVKSVYVGGDIAKAPVFVADNEKATIGHFGLAHYHGKVAALNMLGKKTAIKAVPFFWTMFLGKGIRYAGYGRYDDCEVYGNLDEMKFVAYYYKNDKVVSMASCGRDPVVSQFAELLQQNKRIYRKDVHDGNIPWSNQ